MPQLRLVLPRPALADSVPAPERVFSDFVRVLEKLDRAARSRVKRAPRRAGVAR